MKRIVTIQDISCVGKCSLTVALPIISAAGIETAVIPTAVLSTHTAFKGFTFADLTEQIEPISRHWKQEKINFDAIYTGYLGSFEQLEIVSRFIDSYRVGDCLAVIDPVMGDNGKLYAGFDRAFAYKMAELCKKADIILPNLTEAAYMLGMEDIPQAATVDEVQAMLLKLCERGTKVAIMTGVQKDGRLGAMGYDSRSGEFFSSFLEHINVSFHGTGDVFASSFTAALVRGCDLQQATEVAVNYTVRAIIATVNDPDARWYGVNFEQALPYLIERLNK